MPTATIAPPSKRKRLRRERRRPRKKLPTLILEQKGTGLMVGPEHPRLVSLLQTVRYLPENDSRQGTAIRRQKVRLDSRMAYYLTEAQGETLDPGPLVVPYGLREYLAYSWAIRGGDTQSLILSTPHMLGSPSLETQPADFLANGGLLEFLRGQDTQGVDLRSGLIRYAPGRVRALELLLQIALAWPEMIMVVACPTKKRAWQVVNYLRGKGVKARFASPRVYRQDARVTVGTIGGICHACRGGGWKYGFVFYMDVDRVSWLLEDPHPDTWLSPIFLSTAFPKARHLGFLPTDFQGTQFERDMLRGMFGFHEYCIPAHGRVPIDYRVVRVRPLNETPLPTGLSDFELKRQGVWFNKLRNRQVVKLAKLMACDERGPLAAEYPQVATAVGDARGQRVAVLVENVDHALELRRHLQDWPIITGGQPTTAGLGKAQCRWLAEDHQQPTTELPRAIVTEQGLHELGKIDVLLRADAGLGVPQLSWQQQCGPWHEPGQLVVVDVYDTQHPELRRRSRQRWRTYLQARWRRYYPDPAIDEIIRFEKERP